MADDTEEISVLGEERSEERNEEIIEERNEEIIEERNEEIIEERNEELMEERSEGLVEEEDDARSEELQEDLEDSGELDVDLDSGGVYNLSDLEKRLFVPLEVLKSLEASPDYNIVVTKISEYITMKEHDFEQYTEALQQYNEFVEEKDELIKVKTEESEHLQAQLDSLQETNDILDRQNNELLEEKERLNEERVELAQALSSSREEVESLTDEVNNLRMTIEDQVEELDKAQSKIEELKPPPDVPGADRDELLRLLDRRQHEIAQLSNDWSILSEKLEMTSSEKQEIQLKFEEFTSQESTIRLKEQLLSKEKMLIQQQNDWLTKELEGKNSELFALRKEMSASLSEKDTSISAKDQELSHLRSSMASKTSLIQELQGRLDSAHKRLIEAREEQSNVEDKLRREVAAQSKLTSLYQSASEDGEKIVKELMSKLESLQVTLEEMSNEKDIALRELSQVNERFASLQSESTDRISVLEKELNGANDLLTAARHRGALPYTEGEVLSISPTASATSSHLLSGLTLTQIYTRYVETTEELRSVKDENLRLNNYLTQIMQELDEKTPALQKLRRDHDMLLQRCQSQQEKLESVLEECETIRLESEESLKFSRLNERENKRLKSLVGDLGRQVKTLLKECEDARGGVVSTSHDWSRDISSDDITSSSQVISEHLVTFRGIEELQEQNQKLLAVVRELSETREREEREYETDSTRELRERLDTAVKELDILRESREKQKEMVESIVKQRDMYRILLAQSTPLPQGDDMNQLDVSQDSAHSLSGSTPQKTANVALQELKEQFEAYRQEKASNDAILQEQITQYRDEAAATRLDNAKLASKLEYANERYQMLESNFKDLKNEMSALRNKEKILTSSLTKHQTTVDTLTQELLTSREKLSHLEVKYHSLQSERDMLAETERRTREQYNHLIKEQKAQNVLLTNLQTIQNNLERSEFETKSRLTSQVQVLEKEAGLLKEKVHNEEERREKMKDAYETQIQDLSKKLSFSQAHEDELSHALSSHKEMVVKLESELSATRSNMEQVQSQLDEANDRLRAMEEDAGAEFRAKVRLLERKVSDGTNKIASLEEQLKDAQSHSDQYKSISEANEVALQELNRTSEEFKVSLTEQIESLKSREETLLNNLEDLKEEKERNEAELKDELKQTQEALATTQEMINELHSRVEEAEKKMTEAQNDQTLARQDAKRCTELARDHQDLYQRELVQHGHTMEELSRYREKEEERELEMTQLKEEMAKLKEELTIALANQNEAETQLREEKDALEERCGHLTAQNDMLHEEAEKLSARLVTLTEGGGVTALVATPTEGGDGGEGVESDAPSKSDHLWELIRFVRREKEIAETKRGMAESEVTHLKQEVNKLQQQLSDARSQLQELADATKAHAETAAQYEDIMTKVQTLNVLSDSNRLLREEKDLLAKQVETLKASQEKDQQQIQSLVETQHSLVSQKDSLLAEKVALKNEVERWNTRTNQLIEQYNKIDPEEYKQLVEEKGLREEELATLKQEVEDLKNGKEELEVEVSKLREEIKEVNGKREEELSALQEQLKIVKDDLAKKNDLVPKLKELGRKYRSSSEELKKKVDEGQKNIEELEKKISELEGQKSELETQLEEAKQGPSEMNEAQTQLQSEFDQMKEDFDKTKISLAEKEDKLGKVIRTARTLKSKLDTMKAEKDNLEKDLTETRILRDQFSSELEAKESSAGTLQAELDSLRQHHSLETKRLEEKVEKLEQELRSKAVARRRVIQPTVVTAESPSTTVTVQQAPTAAVRPTVTTTPTASIRPMPLQTTSAPTAHVTPTQVTTSLPATSEATPTQSSSTVGSATVFMRSTSPLVVTQTHPQITPSSSNMSEGANVPIARPTERPIKRTRESLESDQLPMNKRSKQVTSEAEPSTTTTDHAPLPPLVDTPNESMTAPDTQTDQEVASSPHGGETAASSEEGEVVEDSMGMDGGDPPRRMESVESEIVADTTSDEATEAIDEAQPPAVPVKEEEGQDESELCVTMVTEPEVAMATEPSVAVATEPARDEIIIEEEEGGVQGLEEEVGVAREDMNREEGEEDFIIVEASDDEIAASPHGSPYVYAETTPQIIEEQSMGLPDDEITMEIPTPSSSSIDRPPSIVISTAQQTSMEPSRRLRLALAERAHTPGTGIETSVAVGDDHQVPCTPILSEDKQLGKAPQSVPGVPTAVSSLASDQTHYIAPTSNVHTSQAEAMSSLGETQLEELSSTTNSSIPVATADVLQDPNEMIDDDQTDAGYYEMMEEIINQESSGDEDIEEGEVPDSQPTTEEIGSQPTSSSMAEPATSQETSSTLRPEKRIQPIVWDQPSTSDQGAERTAQRPTKAPKVAPPRRSLRTRGGRGKGRGAPGRKW